MNLRRTLSDLVRVVSDEAERNPEFKGKILGALGQDEASSADHTAAKSAASGERPRNRRMAATLDPVELASLGEEALRARLSGLTVDQLQDIVSDYAMDPGRLVAKWKTPERIIDRIVELAVARAQKGNAFRAKG
jgi:hypothetical protein